MWEENNCGKVPKHSFFPVRASSVDPVLTLRAVLLSGSLFSQGPHAVWVPALSGLSGHDTNLSSIKIAAKLFFCLAQTVRPLGGNALWVLSPFQDIPQPFPVIRYQNNTLYSRTPPCFLKSAMLMQLRL